MQKYTKRTIQSIVIALLLCVLVSGVVTAKTTLTLWHGFTGANNTEMLHGLIDEFNKQYAGEIQVKPTAYPWDTFYAKWTTAIAMGAAPDLVLYHATSVPEYAEKNGLADIGKYLDIVGFNWEGIPESVKGSATWKGKIVGVPMDVHPIALYINADMAKEAGLDIDQPPTDGASLIQWAQKLTIKDAEGNVQRWGIHIPVLNNVSLAWIWYSLLFQNGGQFLNDDMNKVVSNSPEGVEALQFLVDLVHKYGVSPKDETTGPDTGFVNKKTAMYFIGPWMTPYFLSQKLNFITVPFPRIFDQNAVWGNSHVLSASRQRNNSKLQAVATFMKWMSENSVDYATNIGVIPVSAAVLSSKEFTSHPTYPYFKAFIEERDYVVYEPLIPERNKIFSFAKMSPLKSELEAAMVGKKTPEQALDDMAEGLNDILR